MTRRIVDIIGDNQRRGKRRSVPPVRAEREATPSPEAGDGVYRRLREGITSGEFQPNERLVEANLTRLLGGGRTAIRAALARLDQEGLVTREHNPTPRVRLGSHPATLELQGARSA